MLFGRRSAGSRGGSKEMTKKAAFIAAILAVGPQASGILSATARANIEPAIESYRKSVELDPSNAGGIEALRKLGPAPH
jgi:hypothetical protein